jgi:hypothetical protein
LGEAVWVLAPNSYYQVTLHSGLIIGTSQLRIWDTIEDIVTSGLQKVIISTLGDSRLILRAKNNPVVWVIKDISVKKILQIP